ncbi:hypothetical protein PRZ48_006413 [Zasmidium cellare]|uniref:F-box domain-containing protein n=1 Tax=Zasmidium cellare TaxID=395010 RepID=A0ABR0EPB6_ZASCE|nr:hypothetical protein PRZ48_006413 [Zasmidium cellare]
MAPTVGVSSRNDQAGSKLMQLPQEIRDEIYARVFCSTRFAFGKRAISRIGRNQLVSAHRGRALGLLRSCRRVREEIGDDWLSQVLFHFEDPESMLQKLANVPGRVRGQIRHLRVSGLPLMLSFEDDDVYYRTAQALKLLPGLNLDVLTVLGDRTPDVSYQTLDMLIRHSNGWKELRFISHNSEILGYKDDMMYFGPNDPMTDLYLRQPQPSGWQHALEQRDGPASKPSVTIFRSKEANRSCAILRPDRRTVFSQAFGAGQDRRSYGKTKDEALMRPGEREKEILVIVKRGADIDYCERGGPSFLPVGDIREDFSCETWREVKDAQDELHHYSDDPFDDEDDVYGSSDPILVDKYSHVDEYTWPPLHFEREGMRF